MKQVGVGDNCAPVKAAKHVVIKYDPEYIKSGFIRAGCDAELKAKCVECVETLSAQLFLFFLIWAQHLKALLRHELKKTLNSFSICTLSFIGFYSYPQGFVQYVKDSVCCLTTQCCLQR